MRRSPTGRRAGWPTKTRRTRTTSRSGAVGRLLVLRNVLKAWACVVALALLLGALGWELGGYRLGVLFFASAVLLCAAIYWYADRIVMGMVGARELLPGEAPAVHSTVERLALRAGVVKPRLYVLSDSYPRALSARRARGAPRARDGAPAPSRRARADDRGRARGRARRAVARGRLPAAGAAVRARADCGGV